MVISAMSRMVFSLVEAQWTLAPLLRHLVHAVSKVSTQQRLACCGAGSGRRAWTFTDLLRHVHDVPGIKRIRFATSHPRYFTERLVRACSELDKLCEFFHIVSAAKPPDWQRVVKIVACVHDTYAAIIKMSIDC
jgi:hypothetical protein